MKNIKQHAKFFQGLVLGLFITSALSYATVTLQTFMAGTPISAAQMNANFAAIKTKLDSLDVGYVGVLAAEQTITCGASSTYNYTTLSLTDNYNDGNYASDIYTIPTDGLYKIYLNAESEDTMGYMTKLDFSYDQGTTWESIPIASSNTQYVKMLQEGDKVKLRAGCAYYVGAGGASNDSTIDHTKFAYAIKKF